MTKFNEQEWLKYRANNLDMRFWQALRAYMDVGFILLAETDNEINDRTVFKDTFYLGDN